MKADDCQDSHLVMNHAFEIVGRVTNDLNVKVDQALDFGVDFGMLRSKFRRLFELANT